MAFGGTAGRSVERRREERERQREEERRQKELDRRKQGQEEKRREEAAERQREEMRREEARQEAQEREASYEKARMRHQAFLEQLRVQKRTEKMEEQQEQNRRQTLLASLRDANRQKRREEEREQPQPERREKERPLTAKQDRQPEPQKPEGPAKTSQGRPKKAARPLKPKEKQPTASRELSHLRKAREEKTQGTGERRTEAVGDQQDKKKQVELAQRARVRSAEGHRTDRQAKEKPHLLRLRKREEAREADKAEKKDRQKAAGRKETLRRQRVARRMDEAREAQTEERRKEARDTTIEPEEERILPSREKKRPAPVHDPLASRFPSGLISGDLPWLLTYENRIATSAGDPIALRGVNVRIEGPEGAAAGWTAPDSERYARMAADALDWGVTIVRVGFDPRLALDPVKARAILEATDAVVEIAAARRCYTLLSPGAPTGPGGSAGVANDLISDEMIVLWQLLSEWYAAEPAVLFDLGLPPRDLLAEPAAASDPWAAWSGFIRSLVAEIRVRHPRSVCFVGGMGGGTDLSGFPVIGREQCPVPNLVYTACLYPRQADPWAHLKRLSQAHACFVTEWGGESADVTWGERTARLLGAAAIGWTAASWTGKFPLTRSVAGRVYPTPLGVVVQRALSLATERAEASRLGRFRVLM